MNWSVLLVVDYVYSLEYQEMTHPRIENICKYQGCYWYTLQSQYVGRQWFDMFLTTGLKIKGHANLCHFQLGFQLEEMFFVVNMTMLRIDMSLGLFMFNQPTITIINNSTSKHQITWKWITGSFYLRDTLAYETECFTFELLKYFAKFTIFVKCRTFKHVINKFWWVKTKGKYT